MSKKVLLEQLKQLNGGKLYCSCKLIVVGSSVRGVDPETCCRYDLHIVPAAHVHKLATQVSLFEKFSKEASLFGQHLIIGKRCKEYLHCVVNYNQKKSARESEHGKVGLSVWLCI